MLTVENLHFRYSKFSRPVLNGASLELKAGEIGILLGRNGSGKTTLFKNILGIAKPERGDNLAVLMTGAYNYAMASNYNRICRPPVVIIKDGEDRIAVRRETFEDLTSKDL